MDCRRRSAVDDDRSRKKWAVDEDRRRIRLAVDDDRHRRRWAADNIRRRRRWEVDDYPPLHLPLQRRNPLPHYLHEDSRQRRRAVDLDRRRKALWVAQVEASLDRIDALCVDFMHSVERIMSRSTTISTPSASASSYNPTQHHPPSEPATIPALQIDFTLVPTAQTDPLLDADFDSITDINVGEEGQFARPLPPPAGEHICDFKPSDKRDSAVGVQIDLPRPDSPFALAFSLEQIPVLPNLVARNSISTLSRDQTCDSTQIHVPLARPTLFSFSDLPTAFPHSSTIPLSLPLCSLEPTSDCRAKHVKVYQVIVNEGEDDDSDESKRNQQQKSKRFWGIVVCHYETLRFVPFPLRFACEFLMQVFTLYVNKEFELEKRIREKNILGTQTMLYDMLLREPFPLGIVIQPPNIMDLVKCDSSALIYQNKVWRLGITSSESQSSNIAYWLDGCHMDSTGLSTDSLHQAGYPSILSLGDMICGMVAARITSKDTLFWSRLPTATNIRWASAKHNPAGVDDERMMHPRCSFKEFLAAVKTKSQSWSDHEMDAMHSLQLILNRTVNVNKNKIKKLTIDSQMNDLKVDGILELQIVTNEIVCLIETTNVPILAVDIDGLINGWNMKIAELTSFSVDEAIGRYLLTLTKDSPVDAMTKMLLLASQGKEEKNVEFHLQSFGLRKDDGPIILVVNACTSRDIHDFVIGKYHLTDKLSGVKRLRDTIALGSQLQQSSVKRDACFVQSCFENFEILRGRTSTQTDYEENASDGSILSKSLKYLACIRVMIGHQRRKVFDPGGLIIIFISIFLPIKHLDGVELF